MKKNPNVKINVKTFIDNGNTTYSGAVISQKLMNKLGAKHFKQKSGKIKGVTGNVIKKVGTSEELEIEIQGITLHTPIAF